MASRNDNVHNAAANEEVHCLCMPRRRVAKRRAHNNRECSVSLCEGLADCK